VDALGVGEAPAARNLWARAVRFRRGWDAERARNAEALGQLRDSFILAANDEGCGSSTNCGARATCCSEKILARARSRCSGKGC